MAIYEREYPTEKMMEELKKLPKGLQREFHNVSTWYFEMFLIHKKPGTMYIAGMAKKMKEAYWSAGRDVSTSTKISNLVKEIQSFPSRIEALDLQIIYKEFNFNITQGDTDELQTTAAKPKRTAGAKARRTGFTRWLSSYLIS